MDVTDIQEIPTFVLGWTLRGTWNSKLYNRIRGNFEIYQNRSHVLEFKLRITYANDSAYAAGESRSWIMDGIPDGEILLLKSKNFDISQFITIHLERSNADIWTGTMTSICPADIVGLTGVVSI